MGIQAGIVVALVVVVIIIVIVVVAMTASKIMIGSKIILSAGPSKFINVSSSGAVSISDTGTALTVGYGKAGALLMGYHITLYDPVSQRYLSPAMSSGVCTVQTSTAADTWYFQDLAKWSAAAGTPIVAGVKYMLSPVGGSCGGGGAITYSLGITTAAGSGEKYGWTVAKA